MVTEIWRRPPLRKKTLALTASANTRSPMRSPQECHSSHFPQRFPFQIIGLGKTGKERHLPSQGVGRSWILRPALASASGADTVRRVSDRDMGRGSAPIQGQFRRPKLSRAICPGQTTLAILTGSSLGPVLEMGPVVLTLSALSDMAPFSLCRCIHKPLTAVVSPCTAASVPSGINEGQTSF